MASPARAISRRQLLTVPLAALTLSACSRHTDVAARNGLKLLLRGNGPDPDSLDPQRARSMQAMNVLRDVFECLTRLDRHATPVPAAAESWSVSADGLVYTFTLRPGLRWSNGDPVVAQDFAAGLRRLVDPATASQYAQVVNMILNAGDIVAGRKPVDSLGVTTPDDTTLIVTLGVPAPYLPGLLAYPTCAPLHRASFAKLGDHVARPGEQVSNGAFVLKEWLQGSYIRADRNPHYWNNSANRIDAVKYLQIADENAELRAYRAGELHITDVVPRGQFDWIRNNIAPELHVSPQLTTYYYGFNLDRPLFRDPRLRRALSLVIDRERLASSVLRAAGVWLGSAGHPQLRITKLRLRLVTHATAHRRGAPAVGGRGLRREPAARLRAALQQRRSPHQGGSGRGLNVEGGAGRRSSAGRRRVQITAAGHRSP
jgi:oligopeptide transport system substrate-binding protein